MRIISHRGGRGFGTDNTLEAMEKAVRAGVRRIETDVRSTEDGELILCHDPAIWNHIISRSKSEDLRKHAPERPFLRDVLEKLAGWVWFDIEVKDAPPSEVGSMLEEYAIEKDTLVTSFDLDFLKEFKDMFSHIQTGYLFMMGYGEEKKLVNALEAGCSIVLPHYRAIDEELVKKAHILGLEVYAWTANELEEFIRLWRISVDGVITDRYLDFSSRLSSIERAGQSS
ncbi:MAG: glycerophosphodiester phosphodiesterase [Actinomycetota bacterium]|nr:glycerophosphodiester phosphodiesterase [Actinomycetota bacterium]